MLGSVLTVHAEVSVRTDPEGNYSATQILTTGSRGEPVVWGLHQRSSRNFHALNPRGDAAGDLWPVVLESEVSPHHPWVVWSRFNGTDFDLIWSRWTREGWQQPSPVEAAPAAGNDLDADLVFNGEGRPYLVWSRDVDGVTTIQFSAFLLSTWMPAFQISDPGVDSRYPVIVERFNDGIRIEFDTPEGTASKWIMFSRPVTITDDINPLNHVYVRGIPNYVKE
jgi:hypothetical protein